MDKILLQLIQGYDLSEFEITRFNCTCKLNDPVFLFIVLAPKVDMSFHSDTLS